MVSCRPGDIRIYTGYFGGPYKNRGDSPFIAPQREVPQTPFGIQMLVGGGGCIVFCVRIPRLHVRGGSSQVISSSTEDRSSFN